MLPQIHTDTRNQNSIKPEPVPPMIVADNILIAG